MKITDFKQILGLSLLALVASTCAPPPEPASLKSSGVDSSNVKLQDAEANSKDAEATGDVKYGGALVGTQAQKDAVAACTAKGTFYNRNSPFATACTAFPLLKKSCVVSSLGTTLTKEQKAGYSATMATPEVAGYELDQCLDCASPVGNALCEGTSKEARPGFRIYVVKVVDGVIKIRSMYFAK